jgi:hypothetical protein
VKHWLHEIAIAVIAVFATFGAGGLLHSGILGLLVGVAVLLWSATQRRKT